MALLPAGPTHAVQPRRELVLAAKTILGAAGLSGPDRYWDRRRAALVAATGRDPPSLGADPLTGIAVGSMAAASVLAVAAGTLSRNQVGALAAATGVLFVLPPLAVLLSPRLYA